MAFEIDMRGSVVVVRFVGWCADGWLLEGLFCGVLFALCSLCALLGVALFAGFRLCSRSALLFSSYSALALTVPSSQSSDRNHVRSRGSFSFVSPSIHLSISLLLQHVFLRVKIRLWFLLFLSSLLHLYPHP